MLVFCFKTLEVCRAVTTKFSINIFADLGLLFFLFLFAFASGSLAVCHNSVEDPVGFNCAVI